MIRGIHETAWIKLFKYYCLKTTCKQPLPSPNGELSIKIPLSEIYSTNLCIGKPLNLALKSSDTHSKGPNANLSSAQKFEILKKAAKIWITCSNVILYHSFNGYRKGIMNITHLSFTT